MPSAIGSELVVLLPRLRRFAVALSGEVTLADDLVQSACMRALAAANELAPGTRIDAWMFRIIRNIWIDELRRKRTTGPVEDVEARHDLVGDTGEARAMDRLTLQDVRQAIDRLPPEQREVLVLVCVEDMSYREAAEILGLPVGTVMSRLARARQRVMELTSLAA
ncbi:DNA-directed RNA polymerase sigma-70 factor [Agaricicola taiwanensis]|uniref:DNA-directed RNA polymerase sigma-70 factor n=1 Tax=Agaricicola taiwanensis TaxID=591372 RepID=A0A8J3E0V0_9RHOB|nr:sigma-70 family RNA polymerase sigma factor [Agaricicola taiwanensis]GGE54945.1 DNA-directed RNA polymerase sigma-70 factor [Agaricicola taiwanensis]